MRHGAATEPAAAGPAATAPDIRAAPDPAAAAANDPVDDLFEVRDFPEGSLHVGPLPHPDAIHGIHTPQGDYVSLYRGPDELGGGLLRGGTLRRFGEGLADGPRFSVSGDILFASYESPGGEGPGQTFEVRGEALVDLGLPDGLPIAIGARRFVVTGAGLSSTSVSVLERTPAGPRPLVPTRFDCRAVGALVDGDSLVVALKPRDVGGGSVGERAAALGALLDGDGEPADRIAGSQAVVWQRIPLDRRPPRTEGIDLGDGVEEVSSVVGLGDGRIAVVSDGTLRRALVDGAVFIREPEGPRVRRIAAGLVSPSSVRARADWLCFAELGESGQRVHCLSDTRRTHYATPETQGMVILWNFDTTEPATLRYLQDDLRGERVLVRVVLPD